MRRTVAVNWSSRVRAAGDDGFGMVLVVGYAVVISLIVAVTLASVNSVLKSGTSHSQYAQAVDSAEAGVDQTLARLGKNNFYSPAGQSIPTQWLRGFPDSRTERTWVLNTADSVLATNPSLLQKSAQGEFLALRPVNAQIIYSIGWEPSKAAAKRTRVLRNDYVFAAYNPRQAVLTNGNISLQGSFDLSQNTGTALPPTVHSEMSITSCPTSSANSNYEAVGGNACGGGSAPAQVVPQIEPRQMYTALSSTYASQWYDLCPDGTARQPADTPCSGPLVAGTTTNNARGWIYTPSTKTWSSSAPQPGVYYGYRDNIDMTSVSGSTIPASTVTIFTEATNNLACAKNDGNVHLIKNKIVPAIPYLSIYAGGSVTLDSQHIVGDLNSPGLVAAQENLSFNTSSAPGVVGAAIANNFCGGYNQFQGAQIVFDANMSIRGNGTIKSTSQTELL